MLINAARRLFARLYQQGQHLNAVSTVPSQQYILTASITTQVSHDAFLLINKRTGLTWTLTPRNLKLLVASERNVKRKSCRAWSI